MASNTSYINLYKKDPVADRNDTFNITTMLNDNWDKLDTALFNLNKDKVDKITGKGLSTNDFTTTLKDKLDGIEAGANKYIHPDNHSLDMITETTTKKIMTNLEREKLEGVAKNANNYSHPLKHPPAIIDQDLNNRFISDLELAQIENNKINLGTHLAENANIKHKAKEIALQNGTNLEVEVGNLKSSVSDGKQAIATAITGKEIPTSSSDTFTQMAKNISKISTGKKWASGSFIYNTMFMDIEVGFLPKYIILWENHSHSSSFGGVVAPDLNMYLGGAGNSSEEIFFQLIGIKTKSFGIGSSSFFQHKSGTTINWIAFE